MSTPVFPPRDSELTAHRLKAAGELAGLFESQTRTRLFSETLGKLTRQMHAEVVARLGALIEENRYPEIAERLADTRNVCERLSTSFDLLLEERNSQWDVSHDALCNTINEFDEIFSLLSNTLVERELLERQSQVLEQIILSHERIGQWKAFVQAILNDFHSIFPFDLFFVAFAEENGLMLNVYYFGECDEQYRRETRNALALRMIEHLGLPADSPLDYDEFQVQGGRRIHALRAEQMITVRVPEHSSQLAGLLGVTFLSSQSLNPREESVIRSILAVMVMVVGSSKVLSRTLGELEYYSMHDPLTGLYNRRQFNNMLEYEIGRSERHKHEFSLLLLDLDDFKDVNDSYGHPTGDQVLVGVAEILRRHLRKGDLATRIGGDEFAILLMETGSAGALQVAEKLGGRCVRTPLPVRRAGVFTSPPRLVWWCIRAMPALRTTCSPVWTSPCTGPRSWARMVPARWLRCRMQRKPTGSAATTWNICVQRCVSDASCPISSRSSTAAVARCLRAKRWPGCMTPTARRCRQASSSVRWKSTVWRVSWIG